MEKVLRWEIALFFTFLASDTISSLLSICTHVYVYQSPYVLYVFTQWERLSQEYDANMCLETVVHRDWNTNICVLCWCQELNIATAELRAASQSEDVVLVQVQCVVLAGGPTLLYSDERSAVLVECSRVKRLHSLRVRGKLRGSCVQMSAKAR